MLVLTGSIAAGSVLWGALADWSLAGAHAAAACSLVALTFLARRRRLDVTAGIDVTPVPGTDPMVTLMPGPNDGPVLVTIAYRVRPSGHGRVRGRDAAHREVTAGGRAPIAGDCSATSPTRNGSSRRSSSIPGPSTCASTTGPPPPIDAQLQRLYVYLDGEIAVSHYLSAYSPSTLGAEVVDEVAASVGENDAP